jgi:predicted enzyme related to lactoylglutathione lyase
MQRRTVDEREEKQMSDPVVHFEVMGKDGAALQRFYQQAFDWKIDTNNPMNYGMVAGPSEGVGIGGGVGQLPDETYPNYATFYIAVDDTDAALKKVEELGGKTVMPTTELPMVTIAMFTDVEGNLIGLTKNP